MDASSGNETATSVTDGSVTVIFSVPDFVTAPIEPVAVAAWNHANVEKLQSF